MPTLLALLLLALPAADVPVVAAGPGADGARLGPGDQVELRVPGQREALLVRVDEHGGIDLGDLGVVAVAGLTEEAALFALREHLRTYLRSVDGVDLTWKARGRMVLVTGMVSKPGQVILVGQGDLWRALFDAGGPVDGADLARVAVTRKDQRFTVDVRSYLSGEQRPILPELKAGDTVLVPAQPGWNGAGQPLPTKAFLADKALVLGAVGRPGPVPIEGPFDPIVALALAGGARPDAALADARIDAEGASLNVDLAARLRGDDSQVLPALFGPVVLFVPSSTAAADISAVRTVRVMGAVRNPGLILVDGPIDLMDLLARAGGPADNADLSRIDLFRRTRGATLTLQIDGKARLREGGAPVDVHPGDVIQVPPRGEDLVATGLQVLSQVALIASVVALLTSAVAGAP